MRALSWGLGLHCCVHTCVPFTTVDARDLVAFATVDHMPLAGGDGGGAFIDVANVTVNVADMSATGNQANGASP